VIVGMNKFQNDDDSEELSVPVHRIPEGAVGDVLRRIEQHLATRDAGATAAALAVLERAARGLQNCVRPAIEAAKAGATHGEIVGAIRTGFDYPANPMEAGDVDRVA
jgi:methylmalonyl-CoA mutase